MSRLIFVLIMALFLYGCKDKEDQQDFKKNSSDTIEMLESDDKWETSEFPPEP